MAPGYAFGYVTLLHAHAALGNEDKTVEAFANMFRYVGGNPAAAEMLETAYETLGYSSSMLAVGDAMAELTERQHVPAFWVGVLYMLGSDYDKAIDWFESAYEQSDPDSPYLGALIKDPNIRKLPRFQALLRKMGLHYWAENP